MSSRMTGKQRAARIPLDYFRKPDALLRWKLGLSALALVAAAGWAATGFSWGGPKYVEDAERGRLRYSRGPVARVHAMWDARCEACHAPFASIRGEPWAAQVGLAAKEEEDSRCMTCHQVGDHAKNMKPAEVGSCASCHVDHRGRDASLVLLDDSTCVKCHGDLSAHVASGAVGIDERVTAFPGGHGEFRALRDPEPEDPGALKFNHALHMTPGLNAGPGSRPLTTIGQLSAVDQVRYGGPGAKATDGVALKCDSCHHPEPGGASFRPVTFEGDCRSCHAIDVAVAAGPGRSEVVSVPHGLQPEAVRERLVNAAIGLAMRADAKAEPERPMPGRAAAILGGRPGRDDVAARASRAERLLTGPGKAACSECHRYDTPDGLRDAIPPGSPLSSVTVQPTKVPTSWFAKALFDHSAHRGVSCRSCHGAAYPDSGSASATSRDVMLPNMASCAECHAPGARSAGGPIGGAGHSCVECHRYHGDHGEAKTPGREALTVRQFLLGSPPHAASPPQVHPGRVGGGSSTRQQLEDRVLKPPPPRE